MVLAIKQIYYKNIHFIRVKTIKVFRKQNQTCFKKPFSQYNLNIIYLVKMEDLLMFSFIIF